MPGHTATKNGRIGENAAAQVLQHAGYSVLTKNYRSQFGEIDIVAQNSTYLIFAEVKTRSPHGYGRPGEAVNVQKMRRILKTAQFYLLEHPIELQPRFDVIEVFLTVAGDVQSCRHIENAFDAGDAFFMC